MADAKDKEKVRLKEIEADPELKEELGIDSIGSYVEYFKNSNEYDNISYPTVNKWLGKISNKGADKELTQILDAAFKYAMAGKNPAYLRTWLEQKGYFNKKEDSTVGFSPAELIGIGQQVRQALIDEFRNGSGNCPICNFSKTLYDERLGQGREQSEEGEMATLAVSS